MMPNNKLYTRSYFCKRLKDADIPNRELVTYRDEPSRRWTVLIYPGTRDILCTCHKNDQEYWFRLETASNSNLVVKTQSMKVVIDLIAGHSAAAPAPSEPSVGQ